MILGVNIDHIATLRQLRGTPYPDILEAARIAESAGAAQITAHLREDRRHIQDRDVELLKKKLRVPLNLEMALSNEIIDIALKLKPAWVCLVPEKRREVTTEGGLDVSKNSRKLRTVIPRMKKAGIRVSLFIEPEMGSVRESAALGANAVEFHTGRYCLATQKKLGSRSASLAKTELSRLKTSAIEARRLGLRPHAGHGLDYDNVYAVARLKMTDGKQLIEELNIGHSIICRAAIVGLAKAVREMISAMRGC